MAVGPASIQGDLEQALEEVNVPSYTIDRVGIITWINPAAERVVGDVRGQPFTAVVAPEDQRRARDVFARKIFGKDTATDVEGLLLQHDGKRIVVEISSTVLREGGREGGRVVGVFGLVTQKTSAVDPATHPVLTPREMEVLRLLADGESTRQIADQLGLAIATVRNHVQRILHALGAHSRLEALAIARREGLLTP
jgi:PAS domain S-box-containing protein